MTWRSFMKMTLLNIVECETASNDHRTSCDLFFQGLFFLNPWHNKTIALVAKLERMWRDHERDMFDLKQATIFDRQETNPNIYMRKKALKHILKCIVEEKNT